MNSLYLIAIALIFVASFFLIFRNFKLSLYVLLTLSVLLHKELFSFYRWDLMPVRLFMLALFFVGIVKTYFYVVKHGGIKSLLPYIKDPFIALLLLIWLTRGLSIIFSKNLQASIFLFGFFTTTIVLGIYLYLTFKDSPAELFKYLRFFIYLVFALTIFGYFQLFYFSKTTQVIGAMWPVPGKIPRVGSTFWDVNHYGALIAALIPILFSFILFGKNKKLRILDVLILISYLASLLLTNSRTAWMLAGFSFMFFVTIILIRKFGAKGILYILLAITLVSAPFIYEYNQKKSSFRRMVRDAFHYRIDSFDSHFMLLEGTYQVFEKYPFLGGGYGSFFEHFSKTKIAAEFFTRDTAALTNRVPAHTIWGESLSETGIFGTVPFVIFLLLALIVPLYVFFKGENKEQRFLGGMISSILFGWYLAGVFYSYNSEFFWILVFSYFIWGVGTVGKDWFKKVLEHFLTDNKVIFYGILTVGALLIFSGLGKNYLIPWDEAIYAKVAKNMVANNNYMVPHWDNLSKGWYEKPPLYMWMMSVPMRLIGFNSWSARLPSALFGLLTIVLVYLLAKKLFNKTTAFISSLALMTTVHFLYYSRASMLDVTTTFFITLALVLYWKAKESEKYLYWVLSGLFIGVAVMVKGVVGFLPFLVVAVYEIVLYIFFKQRFSKKLFLSYFLTFFSALIIAGPWHFAMYKMFGKEFIDKYVLYHVWDRATTVIEDKGNPFYWYLIVMKVSMRIWFVALLGALPYFLFKSYKKDKKHVFLLVWAVVIFLFFSIAKSKLVWYIIPIYPVVSIMVGAFSDRVLNFVMEKRKELNNRMFKIFAVFSVFVFSLFYLFWNREMVYTSDLNGPQAKLLILKDKLFGSDQLVYLDRIEIPTALFYTDGPFIVIDANFKDKSRIPMVDEDEPLVVISKKGRYETTVPGYTKNPKIVKEYDPWVLWYISPETRELLISADD